MASSDRHARARSGYSLVELMVAMTAGAILISTGYILTRSSSDFFHRTSHVATTQAGVRMAAERLRADIARAGFLGHPDSLGVTNDCGGSIAQGMNTLLEGDTNTVRAVEMATVTAVPGNNEVRQGTLVMTGNYVTNERYRMVAAASASVLRLDTTHEGFRRTFELLNPAAATTWDSAAFANAFQAGRMVRIDTNFPYPRTFFRRIRNVNALPANTPEAWTIQLQDPLPAGCPKLEEYTGGFVSPLTTVVYEMVSPAAVPQLARLVNDHRAIGSQMEWALIRRELSYMGGDPVPVAGSERVVLENAVEFGLTALICNTPGAPCAFSDLLVDADLTAVDWSQVQGLRVRMAARTPELDPTFDPAGALDRGPLPTDNPLLSWRPTNLATVPGGADFTLQAGRARVRSTSFDVALINSQQP